jgi:hypothetical protein
MTARTSKPGVSISAEDLAALEGRRVTLQDLADRERCTKQNISKRIARMRSTSSTSPSIPTTPTITPVSAPPGPTIPTGPILIDATEIATSACLGLLHRAHVSLIGPDQIGPSGLKALATVISTATAELRLLNVMASADEDTTLSVLTVRTMSDEEHDQAKAAAELLNDYED